MVNLHHRNGKDGDKGETGEAGKDGNSVEVKDGYWYINGEKTDYVAVIKEDLGKALVPYVEMVFGYSTTKTEILFLLLIKQ